MRPSSPTAVEQLSTQWGQGAWTVFAQVTEVAQTQSSSHTSVNILKVIHRSSDLFPTVDNLVDKAVDHHFHWVETPKPAAMKPKPTTMFQLLRLSIGRSPSVT